MSTTEQFTRSKRFLDADNQLDRFLRTAVRDDSHPSHSKLLEASPNIPDRFKPRLRAYAKLRNAIVHDERGIDQPIAEPHAEEVELYEQLLQQILNPPTAMTRAIQIQEIFCVNPSDSAFSVIREMNKKVYTHAPLLDGGCVVGVFSENTVFSYLGHHREAILDSTVKINEFSDFLPVEAHASESFEFVSRHTSWTDITKIFRKGMESHYRLGAIFITENGSKSQRLLGMLTSWDIAAADFS